MPCVRASPIWWGFYVTELVEHIEEEDFFLKYGNPILIKGENGIPDAVIVSAKFYNRLLEI